MIFLTIGTLQPFDRLIKTVDELVGSGAITEPVVAQIGHGEYTPQHMESYAILDKDEFDAYMEQASIIISHAGMGSIITAIKNRKPMIVMPRLSKFREHVNDHQLDSAQKFEEIGVVLFARDEHELMDKIKLAADFTPAGREARIDTLVARISRFLNTIQ